jgi:YHS domain-containing protein
MKLTIISAAVLLALSISTVRIVMAEDAAEKSPTTAPSTQPTASADIVNKDCLVSDEKVDPKAPTVTYEGKVIGFCCEDCIKDFNKNPKKYMAKLK